MKVFYDRVPDTHFGTIYIAVSARGVIAVQLGGTERRFAGKVAQLTGVAPRRSTRRAGAAARRLHAYLAGKCTRLSLRPYLTNKLTPFQRRVLRATAQIRRGRTATYGKIAQRVGQPEAARAVGQALRRNPLPLVIPCHRVTAADGSLGGYAGGGIKRKSWLLELEGAL